MAISGPAAPGSCGRYTITIIITTTIITTTNNDRRRGFLFTPTAPST
jgi:hypothetical protein